MKAIAFLMLIFLSWVTSLLPPKFQWRTIDFAWDNQDNRAAALCAGNYIPENNLPTGLARWKDKLFITIPRWKKGIPSSLNYVNLYGGQTQPLIPYPSWNDAFVSNQACCITSNATVVSTFRVHVDCWDRLWVADNGVADMAGDVKQVGEPAVVVFDLNTDTVIRRFVLPYDVLQESSVMTSIVVDVADKKSCNCTDDTYAYITDMGSSAIIVYSFKNNEAWRVEHPFFHFDPLAGVYNVGGVEFYWNDGVSSAALSKTKKDGYRDLYFHPTSSTKQFKMSTKFLRSRNVSKADIFSGVEIVGDKGPKSQSTACDYDESTNVLFYTQAANGAGHKIVWRTLHRRSASKVYGDWPRLARHRTSLWLSKNGVGCWNTEKPFTTENIQLLISDCNMLEFPNDIKVDQEGNIWILSDRQSRFLYQSVDFREINFRVLTAPVSKVIQGTTCDKTKGGFFKRKKSK